MESSERQTLGCCAHNVQILGVATNLANAPAITLAALTSSAGMVIDAACAKRALISSGDFFGFVSLAALNQAGVFNYLYQRLDQHR